MKRILIILVLIGLVAGMGFAQSGDARTKGMAGAFTAVADDLNAIYLNPAGLGFLKNKNFVVGLDFNLEMNKRLVFGEEEFPDIEQSYDSGEESWIYWDEFMGTNVEFNPEDYGFATVEEYNTFKDAYSFFTFADNTSNLLAVPHIAYATKGWGVSTINDIGIEFVTQSDYYGDETPLNVEIAKKVGVMGAIGFHFGPVGVGANVKYYTESSYTLDYTAEDFMDGPPDDFFQQIFMGPNEDNLDSEVESEPHLEMGVGALATIGTFSVGAYIDNLLFFLDLTGESVDLDQVGLFDSLSVGGAWTPFDNKLKEKRGILNLIAALDLKNIGDDVDRELAAGAEIGINLGRVIMLNTRLGYNQSLPGTLATAFNDINPFLGTYSVGVGMKFLIGEFNFAMEFPADMVMDPPTGNLTEEELDTLFGNGVFEFRMSF